jgi:hypothetical protein
LGAFSGNMTVHDALGNPRNSDALYDEALTA